MAHRKRLARGRSWNRVPVLVVALALMIAGAIAAPAGAADFAASDAPTVKVIVRQAPGAGDLPAEAIAGYGGEVLDEIDLIDALVAMVPEDRLGELEALPQVVAVTPDASIKLFATDEFADDGTVPLTDEEVAPLTVAGIQIQADFEARILPKLQQVEADRQALASAMAAANGTATRSELRHLENSYRQSLQSLEVELKSFRKAYNDVIEDTIADGAWDRLYGGVAWMTTNGGVATTMDMVTHETGARMFWGAGFDGTGIDVALIDSGVAPVFGFTEPGRLLNGPDLSFDSQAENLRYIDGFGHGTHMATAINAYDPGAITPFGDPAPLRGMAPGARLVNMKAGATDGAVDVSQVIAALDWIVQYGQSDGMNIRVVNLSFGTETLQDYRLDPLAYAAEQAWHHGIVVVVAAGNDGNGVMARNPAMDPYVINVGSVDSDGSFATPDPVSSFTNCTTDRFIDVLAPGRSIVALVVPGSHAAVEHPEAMINDGRFIKGSGTSQAAAVVSGAVALLLEQRPYLTPDEVKAILMETAAPATGSPECVGAGVIDLAAALTAPTPANATQTYELSTGLGSLNLARGNIRVFDEGVALEGELDIMGNTYDAAARAQAQLQGASWSNGEWNGASWSGASWSGASWSSASWSGASWSGASWSSKSWSSASWSGASWSGASWSGASWSGASWSGDGWHGLSWH